LARFEGRMDPAMGQPGLLHHVGHAGATVALLADRARRGLHDALVGLGLDAARRPCHMMAIILSPAAALARGETERSPRCAGVIRPWGRRTHPQATRATTTPVS